MLHLCANNLHLTSDFAANDSDLCQNGYEKGDGIHSIVLNAVVETPPGRNSYGTLYFYKDRIELLGVDTMQSLTLGLH